MISDHAHVDAESRRESDAAIPPDATPPQRVAGADVRPSRARQSVPPALRRAVLIDLERDGSLRLRHADGAA